MRFPGALAAGLLILSGCVAPAPAVSPSLSDTAPAPSSAAATPSGSASATSLPSSTYTGPLPLPASDGRPMLWPAPTEVSLGTDDYMKATRYGFVDTHGVLVVPPRYEGYEYCRDAAGRVSSIVATAGGRKAAVLDLSGAIVRTLSTDEAACGPVGTVIVTRSHGMDDERWENALIQVDTGRVLLPLASKRHIVGVDARTVNVSDRDGEYFFDAVTRRRTPHPGDVTESDLEPGAPGVPASARTARGEKLIGFIATSGTWAIAPAFVDAYPFSHGFATVELEGGGWTFLDVHGQQVGGEWEEIEPASYEVPGGWRDLGYVVNGTGGYALLGSDLRTVVDRVPGTVTCDSESAGACSVVPEEGPARLVQLPQGTVTDMPDGFEVAVGPGFIAARPEGEENSVNRILATATGRIAELDSPYLCRAAGPAWAACDSPDSPVLPPFVLDTQGRRTPFRSITAIYGAERNQDVSYYWATTARYEGIVDDTGTWHYRQSRFTRLED